MKKALQVIPVLIAICIAAVPACYAFELNGFADVSFNKCTDPCPEDEGRNGSFAFGTLDLYLAQTLEEVDILIELVVEDGGELDLERLVIGYTFSDAVKFRAGRFHTPLGFWNTLYHHGVQIQPTIERPDFLRFEDDGGILATHVVGATLSGSIRTGAGAIDYGFMIGNGPKVTASEEGDTNVLHPNNTSDNNNGKAVAFNIAVSPKVIDGLKIGVSGHMAEIESDGSVVDSNGDSIIDSVKADQTILGTAFMYSSGSLSLAGEYFRMKNSDEVADNDYDASAYYGLITYGVSEKWAPYLMYENLLIDESDPYFISLGAVDTEELTAGLRYNVSYRSSVKGEYRRIIDEGGKDWDGFALQWALAF